MKEEIKVNWNDPFPNILTSLDTSLLKVIRKAPPDSFSYGQIYSKLHLVKTLFESQYEHLDSCKGILVCGGWIGLLPYFIHCIEPWVRVDNLEIDESLECINYELNTSLDFEFIKGDMLEFDRYDDYDIIINTSTEHLLPEDFKYWLSKIPEGKLVVMQNNDMVYVKEHVNCYLSLDDFVATIDKEIYHTSVIRFPDFHKYTVICGT